MNRRKNANILQILPALNVGGVEKYVVEVSKAIDGSGFNCFVASAGGKLESALPEGVTHLRLPLNRKSPWAVITNLWRLHKLLKKHHIDLVIAHSRLPAWLIYLLRRWHKFRFITTIHGAHRSQNKLKRFYNSIITKGDIVIAVSQFIADYTRQHFGDIKQLQVVYNGIDTHYFSPREISASRQNMVKAQLHLIQNQKTILFLGRQSRSKGIDLLIEAFAGLNLPDYKLLIIGAGHKSGYQKELNQLVDKLNLAEKVIFANNIKDIPALISLCEFMVLPSRVKEAFGLVIAEGMAMAKPVITTKLGASQELIEDGVDGFLVAPEMQAIKEKIAELIAMPEKELAEIGFAARAKIVKQFCLTRTKAILLKTYREILQQ